MMWAALGLAIIGSVLACRYPPSRLAAICLTIASVGLIAHAVWHAHDRYLYLAVALVLLAPGACTVRKELQPR